MKDSVNTEEYSKLQIEIAQREKQERLATASLASEALKSLNISIDALPQKCQQLLKVLAEKQAAMDINQIDSIAFSQRYYRDISQQLDDEYEMLVLRQKNLELDRQIERNKKFLEDLRRELKSSKEMLMSESPNPGDIHEHVRQTKQKLTSYEQIYEKAKTQFSKLHVPEGILPKSIEGLANKLAALREEETELKQRADDITLAREARETLFRLRR